MVGKTFGRPKPALLPWMAFLALLAILAILCSPVLAEKSYLADLAGTFSSQEAADLEQSARLLGEQYQMDIVIVTTNDAGGKTARQFADDYFDYQGYGVGADRDGILFLIDFDNREAYISTSGIAIRYITDVRLETILDAVFSGGMTDKDYYGAAKAFLSSTASFLAAGIPDDQYNEPEKPNSLTAVDGIAGAAVSGLASLWFYAGTRSAYKGRARGLVFNYRQNSLLNLGLVGDDLVNTYVTSRALPRPTTTGTSFGGGRSSTHVSGSGRTHGGGGRGF
jgi:uncharacterized protein